MRLILSIMPDIVESFRSPSYRSDPPAKAPECLTFNLSLALLMPEIDACAAVRSTMVSRQFLLNLLLVEDNANLRAALKTGLEATGQTAVAFACASGEEALVYCLAAGAREAVPDKAPVVRDKAPAVPDVALMDVQLAGEL